MIGSPSKSILKQRSTQPDTNTAKKPNKVRIRSNFNGSPAGAKASLSRQLDLPEITTEPIGELKYRIQPDLR